MFSIGELKKTYCLEVFVETGTYKGSGVAEALKYFDSVYSIEANGDFCREVQSKYPLSKILRCDSTEGIGRILPDITGKRVLWWLDAHLGSVERPYPLKDELHAIMTGRDTRKDVLLMDDLRIYEPGEYEDGPYPKEYSNAYGNTEGADFIYDTLGNTHNLKKTYMQTGAIIALPRVFP